MSRSTTKSARGVLLAGLALGCAVGGGRAQTSPAPVPTPAPAEPAAAVFAAVPPTPEELLAAGSRLFEALAPPEIKAQFEFPTPERWADFVGRLQRAFETESMAELAALAPEARAVLTALKSVSGYEDLAGWLEQRLDELEGAGQAVAPPPAVRPSLPPLRPGVPVPPEVQPVPHYNLWLARVRGRPLPAGAATLMPRLRAVFAAEGVPPELAWLAEAESSLNPAARSPVGAKGLFQFMPATAEAMGLRTWLPDERTDPEKSARAAAQYLKKLHARFGNWALVLAAYNAGEGRVGRLLGAKGAKNYTAIADALPAETRMYVPKVCALIATRAGVAPHQIAAPRR